MVRENPAGTKADGATGRILALPPRWVGADRRASRGLDCRRAPPFFRRSCAAVGACAKRSRSDRPCRSMPIPAALIERRYSRFVNNPGWRIVGFHAANRTKAGSTSCPAGIGHSARMSGDKTVIPRPPNRPTYCYSIGCEMCQDRAKHGTAAAQFSGCYCHRIEAPRQTEKMRKDC